MAETPETGFFNPETEVTPQGSERSVAWQASEFIHHDKSAGWYGALAIAAIIAAVLIYFITKDLISVVVVLVSAIILGTYGSRQPRQLQYQIDTNGVQIGDKYHTYDEFRSFAVVSEGAFDSIVFMPLKRFAMLKTVYFAPADEANIVSVLSDYLPLEEHRLDTTDRFLRRIRF